MKRSIMWQGVLSAMSMRCGDGVISALQTANGVSAAALETTPVLLSIDCFIVYAPVELWQ